MKYNVLVLDDNPADITHVERMLASFEDTTYQTYAFSTVEEAITYLNKQHNNIDACLVDYSLNGENAFDFLESLNTQDFESIPVVVMTGQPDIGIDRKLMESGVFDYCSKKNIDAEILDRCLRYAIVHCRKYREKSDEVVRKSRQIAYANHELKNPLNGIIGCNNMLERVWKRLPKDNIDAQSRERVEMCLDIIARSGNRLKNLISELLDYSQLDIDKGIKRLPVDLNEIVTEAWEELKNAAAQDGLSFSLDTSAYPAIVYGDKSKLRQIAMNLISNAIKYTQDGCVEVKIENIAESNAEFVQLVTTDTGIGIDGKDQAHIFEEFYQAHRTDCDFTKNVESTGLGLAITHRLVSLHGGTLSVTSEKGVGSTFVAQFPVRCE